MAFMRIFLCGLLVLLAGSSLAPTSQDLHKMYDTYSLTPRRDGNSNSVESFDLAPNVKLTVQYGADKHACVLILEPQVEPPTGPGREQNHEQLMSQSRISEILEQVAPEDKRGEKLVAPSGIFCAGSNGVHNQNYANVFIRHDIRCGEGDHSEKRVMVHFKREICPKFDY
jgi:hypothetical protein